MTANELTLEQGNKLIADFMGLSVVMKHNEWLYADWDGLHSVKYHSSWDRLMPVVEKINELKLPEPYKHSDVIIFRYDCHINAYDAILIETNRRKGEQLVSMVWRAVVQFIEWFNEQKP